MGGFLVMGFCDQLAKEKARLGLTQAELARVLGMGKRTVEMWLSGDRVPPEITQEGALARLENL